MFARVDGWLFRRVFEPAAHEFQAWTGLTNFVLAWGCYIVWAASIVSDAWSKTGATRWVYIAMCVPLPVLLIGNYLLLRSYDRSADRGFRNPDKVSPFAYGCRALFSVFVVITVLLSLAVWRVTPGDIGQLAFWAHWYFQACDPMPPNKQRSLAFWRTQSQPTGV